VPEGEQEITAFETNYSPLSHTVNVVDDTLVEQNFALSRIVTECGIDYPTVTNYLTGRGPKGTAVGDFDGQNDPDFVTVSKDDEVLSVFLNNGDGTFADAVQYTEPAFNAPTAVAVGDFNQDGWLDVCTCNTYWPGDLSIFLNDMGG